MANKDGLSLGYRLWWNIRRVAMSIFGPAQLGDNDPLHRLKAEREAKIAQYHAQQN
ncbi:hypothetical protein [Dermatophilus congolensis]|uniref:Uncharacterized protein n=1 Tax=Dermatophilus congolensis TaxID=1863 RepID=A0AA46GZS1_9MICO|nr:hypothetical protein [Dermatophilus congolensis]STD05717.1 Uncharacterised protein [Dermatophilus congolensis]